MCLLDAACRPIQDKTRQGTDPDDLLQQPTLLPYKLRKTVRSSSNAFLPRTLVDWNSMPNSITTIQDKKSIQDSSKPSFAPKVIITTIAANQFAPKRTRPSPDYLHTCIGVLDSIYTDSDGHRFLHLSFVFVNKIHIIGKAYLRRSETMFQENWNWLYDHLNRFVMLDLVHWSL